MVWVIKDKIVEKWLKGNKNYFKLAWVKFSNWLYEGIPGEINLSKRNVRVSEGSNNLDD